MSVDVRGKKILRDETTISFPPSRYTHVFFVLLLLSVSYTSNKIKRDEDGYCERKCGTQDFIWLEANHAFSSKDIN